MVVAVTAYNPAMIGICAQYAGPFIRNKTALGTKIACHIV